MAKKASNYLILSGIIFLLVLGGFILLFLKNRPMRFARTTLSSSPTPSSRNSPFLSPLANQGIKSATGSAAGVSDEVKKIFNFGLILADPLGLKFNFTNEEGLKHDDFVKLAIMFPPEFVFANGKDVGQKAVVGKGKLSFTSNDGSHELPIIISNDQNVGSHKAHFIIAFGDQNNPARSANIFLDSDSGGTKLVLSKDFSSPVRSPDLEFTIFGNVESVGNNPSGVIFSKPPKKEDYKLGVTFDFVKDPQMTFEKTITVN